MTCHKNGVVINSLLVKQRRAAGYSDDGRPDDQVAPKRCCALLQTLSLPEKRAVQSAMPVWLAASAPQSAPMRGILTQQLVLHQRGGEVMPMRRESRKCAPLDRADGNRPVLAQPRRSAHNLGGGSTDCLQSFPPRRCRLNCLGTAA